jgi:septal ring factor EnvC (AmiA/AmiB activator)
MYRNVCCHKLGQHVSVLRLPVLLQVAPKRAALAAAQESLDKTLAELASAQARLLAVQEKIAALEAQFEEATAKKASLAAQVRTTRLAAPHFGDGVLQLSQLVA